MGRSFVTTNYDRWLDIEILPEQRLTPHIEVSLGYADRLRRETTYRPDEMRISLLNRNDTISVVHLHGSVEDPSSLVLTTGDYIKRYAQSRGQTAPDNNAVQFFLEDLFHKKNVLFIGYGLNELEILEYVILKAKRQADGEFLSQRHFILQPFFSHERDLANGIANYFKNQCGVHLIPFLRDERNYAQLIDVVEYFAQEIPVKPVLNIERRTLMDRLLDNE